MKFNPKAKLDPSQVQDVRAYTSHALDKSFAIGKFVQAYGEAKRIGPPRPYLNQMPGRVDNPMKKKRRAPR